MADARRIFSAAVKGASSLDWWRDRVFVPYVVGTATRLHPSYPGYEDAVDVMAEDWDTLVILDACRADAFEDVVDIDTFDQYSTVVSQGSHSSEWTRRTFNGETFPDTIYISANPHTSLLADGTFHELVETWRKYEKSPNMINPTEILDAAVAANERSPNKRLIVHFMQPHGTGGLVETSDYETAYQETIAEMVDVVTELADRVGGKTVVTADHGELFNGGWKAKVGIDSHKARLRFPGLVSVPWATLDGKRRTVTEGDAPTETRSDLAEINDRLRDLGYQ